MYDVGINQVKSKELRVKSYVTVKGLMYDVGDGERGI